MPRYAPSLATPGLPDKTFTSGFQGGDKVTLLIGPQKTNFEVAKNHLVHTDFFKNCLDGRFLESGTKTIELLDEDPEAFGIYLRWLYGGISNVDEYIRTNQYEVKTWIKLLIMAGKWCLNDLTLNVAKQVYNAAYSEVSKADGLSPLMNWHRITRHHSFRYLFVHIFWVRTRTVWAENFLKLDEQDGGFYRDYVRWDRVMRAIDERSTPRWKSEFREAPEATCHPLEQAIMPLLFSFLESPSVLAPGKTREEQARYVRKFLDL